MQQVTLERLETSDEGTFGRLILPGLTLFSGELPDRANLPNVSCIPAGEYAVRWTYSPRFKRFMYLVDGVAGRAGIRFHSANFMGDKACGLLCQLNGCIAPGMKLGRMDGQKAVLLSAQAMRLFEKSLNREPFRLEVIDVFVS